MSQVDLAFEEQDFFAGTNMQVSWGIGKVGVLKITKSCVDLAKAEVSELLFSVKGHLNVLLLGLEGMV